MRKWRCSVCGYIHTGDEPPEKCPVCGADRTKFVEITESSTASPPVHDKKTAVQKPSFAASKPAPSPLPDPDPFEKLSRMIYKLHIHPISVHVPNGLLPVSVLFVFLAVIFSFTPLASASYFNMIFVVCAMPVVIYSGYSDWKSRFKGALTRVFKIKIGCAATVTLTALMLVLWRTANPAIASEASAARWLFLLFHLVMLAAATVAGYYGGKLVFKK